MKGRPDKIAKCITISECVKKSAKEAIDFSEMMLQKNLTNYN